MPLFAAQNREQLRQFYIEAWRKFGAGTPLEPLEAQVVAVIADHPEYAAWLESGEEALGAEFTPAGKQLNPFLHMGLHLALRDQIATDRPAGIASVHRGLVVRLGSPHSAEHKMLELLGETLWEAQRDGRAPDERRYLERLQTL